MVSALSTLSKTKCLSDPSVLRVNVDILKNVNNQYGLKVNCGKAKKLHVEF